MNKVILMGRLTRDPETKTTSTGKTMARMTLAVDRQKGKDGKKQADFISLIAWDKSAEFAEKYLAKGRQILIEGRIQTGSYEKDGQKRYTTDVNVDRVEFCGSKGGGSQQADDDVLGGCIPNDDIPM
jgi:single-strand DNA-binding protein